MSDKIYFSRRKEIAEEAQEYLRSIGADEDDPFNIVGALNSLGYLKDTKGEDHEP